MHKNVIAAVGRLQRRLRAAKSVEAEQQIEQALDLLLNRPDNAAPPERQIRNALSEAGKKLANRATLFDQHVALARRVQTPPTNAPILLRLEIEDFLARAVRPADRLYLSLALNGDGAERISRHQRISLPRAQERLSRARARACPLWNSLSHCRAA